MLSEIIEFVKAFINKKFSDIMLVIIVLLLVMLSFALGYITAKNQTRQPIQIEKSSI